MRDKGTGAEISGRAKKTEEASSHFGVGCPVPSLDAPGTPAETGSRHVTRVFGGLAYASYPDISAYDERMIGNKDTVYMTAKVEEQNPRK